MPKIKVDQSFKQFLTPALAAVIESGQILLEQYKKFDRKTIKLKSKYEIVTAADWLSEKIILAQLKKKFPDHSFLSEEAGASKNVSEYLWVLDPLDGTTNFSFHNPIWAISLALVYRGRPVLGIVNAPALAELYTAIEGDGAYLNKQKIVVSRFNKAKAINAFCSGYGSADIRRGLRYYAAVKEKGLDCRSLGSAALELCYLAAGRVESLVIPGTRAWDVAAGVVIVAEAGGRVTDFYDQHWRLTDRDIAASNGKLHSEILKIIQNSGTHL